MKRLMLDAQASSVELRMLNSNLEELVRTNPGKVREILSISAKRMTRCASAITIADKTIRDMGKLAGLDEKNIQKVVDIIDASDAELSKML